MFGSWAVWMLWPRAAVVVVARVGCVFFGLLRVGGGLGRPTGRDIAQKYRNLQKSCSFDLHLGRDLNRCQCLFILAGVWSWAFQILILFLGFDSGCTGWSNRCVVMKLCSNNTNCGLSAGVFVWGRTWGLRYHDGCQNDRVFAWSWLFLTDSLTP